MKIMLISAVVAFSAFPTGITTTDAIAQNNPVTTVPLAATTRNAGHIAQATLAAQGDQTAITFLIGGVPNEVSSPPHLYTYIYRGTCASHGATPAYDLNRTLLPDNLLGIGGVLTLSRSSTATLNQLRGGKYTVVVRTSPADGNFDIFCGDVRAS
ncbi:hypothetical protein LJR296_007044 [Cupriavidus necator]|uniref:hypothetical protein n=1 Tax=Cupriavidus necator TaxID=106590 RepID=UPI003ECD2C71